MRSRLTTTDEEIVQLFRAEICAMQAFSHALQDYLNEHDRGFLLGADTALKILPNVVMIPDISIISWSRFPKQKLPRRPIPHLVPELVVEVLSDTNTPREMQSKLERYFEAGVLLVWYIDPATRSGTPYTSVNDAVRIEPTGQLDGGNVLPEFTLSLVSLFEKADRSRPEFEATNYKDLV